MTQTERDLGRRWFEEVWNRKRRGAITEMLAPGAVLHDGEIDTVGAEGTFAFFDRMNSAFSDLHVTVHDSFAEQDRICVRWSCTAKHTGDALGIPAIGKTMRVTGISVMRVANERLVEGWQNWDMLGMMHQLQGGAAPAATYITAP